MIKHCINLNCTAQGGNVEGQATKQPQNASQDAKSLAEYEISLMKHVDESATINRPIDNEQLNISAGKEEQTQATVGASPTDIEEELWKLECIRDADEKLQQQLEALSTTRHELVATFSDLVKNGFKFAIAAANRDVQSKHVSELAKSVLGVPGKKFSGHLLMCSAQGALEAGVKLIGENSEQLTLNTPGLDKTLLVLDGQHRLAALLCHPNELDADILIVPCPQKVYDEIKYLNLSQKNWNVTAHRHLISTTTGQEDKLKDAAMKSAAIYPQASEKFYNYMLTGKREFVKKASVIKGSLPAYDVESATTGLDILRALRLLNPDGRKSKLTTLLLADAVFEAKVWHTGKFKGGNEQFVATLKSFCDEKGGVDKEGADAFLEGFVGEFKNYSLQHSEGPSAEEIEAINAKIDRIIDAGPVKTKGKAIPVGTMFEVATALKSRNESTKK